MFWAIAPALFVFVQRIIRRMATPSYQVLRCTECSTPLALPLDVTSGHVVAACSNCKSIRLYSVSEPGYGTPPTLLEKFKTDLPCPKAGCKHRMPLYALKRDSWNWDDLKCPSGHHIPES
jgi:hypothetical protein